MSNTAYLAHSTFQEDGISSLRLASTSNEDENIVSEFLTDNPKKYIYGTQYSKIDATDLICTGSVEGITSNRLVGQGAMNSNTANWATDTFILPNNGDVLSGIKFFYEFDGIHIEADTGPTATNPSGKAYTSEIGYAIIDTVTVYVGSNVWVETTGLDLYLRNLTETKNDLISELLTAGSVKIGSALDESSGIHGMVDTNGLPKTGSQTSTHIPFSGMIDLKLFSEELQGFLQAGAPNEQIKIKISYNNKNVLNFFPGATPTTATLIGTPLNNMKIKKALYVRNNVFTKSERDHVRDNPIYKTLNISKSIKAEHTITSSKTSKLLDLNSLDLDCSHLIVTILRSSYNGKITHLASEQLASAYFRVFSKYDTSTHGPVAISTVVADNRTDAQKAAAATKSGTINCLTSLDLKINGASAYGGEVDPSFLSNSCKDLGLNDISRISNVYVLPLASKKFGDDSISLRRLRNKSLKVNFCDTTQLNSPSDIEVTVYVTAVGYRPVSYVGGTSSLLFG